MNEKKLMVYANKTGGMIAREFSNDMYIVTLDSMYIRNGSLSFVFNYQSKYTNEDNAYSYKEVMKLSAVLRFYGQEIVDNPKHFYSVAYNMSYKLFGVLAKNYVLD